MKSTKRLHDEAFEPVDAKHTDRGDCDESDFNIVIEIDESEMARVAGGLAGDGLQIKLKPW